MATNTRQSLDAWRGRRRLAIPVLIIGVAGAMAAAACLLELKDDQATPAIVTSVRVLPPPAGLPPAPDPAAWASLSETQRKDLLPLQAAWAGLDSVSRQRWLKVAAQIGRLSPEAQRRAQLRMVEWAKLPPKKRAQARLRYVYAKRVPSAKRHELWKTYQASAASSKPSDKRRTGLTMVAPALAQVQPGATTVPITQLLRQISADLEKAPPGSG